jgi:hypothetical protein
MKTHAKSLLAVLLIAGALFALRFCHPHSEPFEDRKKEFSSYPSLTKAAQPPFEVVTILATALWGTRWVLRA